MDSLVKTNNTFNLYQDKTRFIKIQLLLIFCKIKRLISKPFYVFLNRIQQYKNVCSYLRILSASQPTTFAKVTNLRITQYPLFLTQRHQQVFTLTYRPYNTQTSLSHSSYLLRSIIDCSQPSVPFSYLLRRKDETPNMNFTNSKLLANSIYLWYNNTNSPKTKYRKQLSKMETHFAGFLFSKKNRKENIMTEIIIKTTSIIYNIMKLLVHLYIKSFEYYPKMTTFCTIYAIIRYLFQPQPY